MPLPAELFLALIERGWRPTRIEDEQRRGDRKWVEWRQALGMNIGEARSVEFRARSGGYVTFRRSPGDKSGLPPFELLYTMLARNWTFPHVLATYVHAVRGGVTATSSDSIPFELIDMCMVDRGWRPMGRVDGVARYIKDGETQTVRVDGEGRVKQKEWAEVEAALG